MWLVTRMSGEGRKAERVDLLPNPLVGSPPSAARLFH